VQAAQFLAVYGRQVCVGILAAIFSGPRYIVNPQLPAVRQA